MPRFPTRMLGLLCAIVFALPAVAFAHPSYLCRGTGQVSASCCCSKHVKAVDCDARVKARSCCELVEGELTAPPSVEAGSAQLIAAPASAAFARWLPMLPVGHHHAPRAALVMRPPGPPRFLINCSFLI